MQHWLLLNWLVAFLALLLAVLRLQGGDLAYHLVLIIQYKTWLVLVVDDLARHLIWAYLVL